MVLFGTLKMQSFILTEVSDRGLLIVFTSSTNELVHSNWSMILTWQPCGLPWFSHTLSHSVSNTHTCTHTHTYRHSLTHTRLKIRSRHCAAAFSLQVPNSCTDLDPTLVYIRTFGTYSKFGTIFPNSFCSRSDFDSRCEPDVFAEPVSQCNWFLFCDRRFSDRLKRLFVVQIPLVTVYRENAEHIRWIAFRWRCDEVEMRGTCLEAQKSMQANLVINS